MIGGPLRRTGDIVGDSAWVTGDQRLAQRKCHARGDQLVPATGGAALLPPEIYPHPVSDPLNYAVVERERRFLGRSIPDGVISRRRIIDRYLEANGQE